MKQPQRMDSRDLPQRNKTTDGVAFMGTNRAPINPVDFEMVTDAEEKKFVRGHRRLLRRTAPKPVMIEPNFEEAQVIPGLEDNPIPGGIK